MCRYEENISSVWGFIPSNNAAMDVARGSSGTGTRDDGAISDPAHTIGNKSWMANRTVNTPALHTEPTSLALSLYATVKMQSRKPSKYTIS